MNIDSRHHQYNLQKFCDSILSYVPSIEIMQYTLCKPLSELVYSIKCNIYNSY